MSQKTMKKQTMWIYLAVAIISFLLGMAGAGMFGTLNSGLAGAAALSALEDEFCDASPLLGDDPIGIVLADPLNFRIGPGIEYQRIMTLDICTPVKLNGRTSDSLWLLVEAPGNLEGWVYSYYIKANVNLSELEVKTGFGGPTSGGTSSGSPSVSVVIQYDQAVVFITGMPANSAVTAVLGPSSGSSKSLLVAEGTTDANGSATLTFYMPDEWADGSDVASGTLALDVTAGDVTVYATLSYYDY